MSKEEVEKMQKEAEAHAEEDKKAKEAIEIKNNADTLAYQCEKQLKDLGDKVPADKRKPVEDAIAKVREALKANDTDAMKTDLRRLAEQVPGDQRRALQAGRRECRARARRRSRWASRPAGRAASRRPAQGPGRRRRRGVRSRRRRQEVTFNNHNLPEQPFAQTRASAG